MTIPETLRALREEGKLKLNQTQLGKKLNMTQMAISRLETGNAHMQDDDIIAYCLYFGVSADYILGLPKGLKYPER